MRSRFATIMIVSLWSQTNHLSHTKLVTGGDDFYNWFLGPRMIYTSGIVSDITRAETLEELQDNKMKLVCEKLDLKEDDRLLDVGCGWGTLAAFAAKNYGCDVTGITLGKNQTKFGNDRIKENGVSHDKARILCMDYREIPGGPGHYTKIVSLEMAEVCSDSLGQLQC